MKSNYERYLEIKNYNTKMIEVFKNQKRTERRNKVGLKFYGSLGNAHFCNVHISTGFYSGNFGNSSVTSDGNIKNNREVLIKTLNDKRVKQLIIDITVDRLQNEIQEAKFKTKQKAQEVLKEVK